MRIRQIVLVASDLDAALRDLHDVFAIDVAFHDPGVGVFGLHNGVMPVGEQFLEVVSPQRGGTAAGRYLERRRAPGNAGPEAGDGGYMVIFQTRDLDARRRHLAQNAIRTAWEIAFDDISTIHLHPRDTGGAIISIDEARPWESWRWAGPDWRDHVRSERVAGLAGVEIQCDDPTQLASRWAGIFELRAGSEPNTLALDDGQWIEFTTASDGRGEGIRSVAIRATDANAIRRAASKRGLLVEDDGSVLVGGVRFVLT